MAGLHTSSLSSNPLQQSFTTKLLLFTTIISLSLACFAFFLQWHGGYNDHLSQWSPEGYQFNELNNKRELKIVGHGHSSNSDWQSILTQRRSPTFPFYGDFRLDSGSDVKPKICIGSTTSAGLEQVLPWIFFHKVIGVSAFYLFLEGKAATPEVSKVLKSIPGVRIVPRTRELDEQQSHSRIWNETWLSDFLYKPCNYELFVKQSFNMEMAIVMAKEDHMDWIFHLDTDELLHPAGTREYSLRELMSFVPEDFDVVIFPNMESCVERDDIKDPFTEVSLFKKNSDNLPPKSYFKFYKEMTHNTSYYFITYANGKSAARVQDHLRPHGAHRWFNYMKTPNATKMEEAVVLHYTYTKFSDLISRRDRCNCKLTKKDLGRCFMLDFDRDDDEIGCIGSSPMLAFLPSLSSAYVIASTATEEEMLQWYRENVVWSDHDQILRLIKDGIFTRIHAPMAIIEGLREAGVFTHVVNSANSNSSSDNQLSSTYRSISSRRKIVNEGGFQAAARRLLEVDQHSTQPSAVPPLSPPVPHNLKKARLAWEAQGW